MKIIGVFDTFPFANNSEVLNTIINNHNPCYFLNSEELILSHYNQEHLDNEAASDVYKISHKDLSSLFLETTQEELELNSTMIPSLVFDSLESIAFKNSDTLLLYGRHYTPTALQKLYDKLNSHQIECNFEMLRVLNFHRIKYEVTNEFGDYERIDMLHCFFLEQSAFTKHTRYPWSYYIPKNL